MQRRRNGIASEPWHPRVLHGQGRPGRHPAQLQLQQAALNHAQLNHW